MTVTPIATPGGGGVNIIGLGICGASINEF